MLNAVSCCMPMPGVRAVAHQCHRLLPVSFSSLEVGWQAGHDNTAHCAASEPAATATGHGSGQQTVPLIMQLAHASEAGWRAVMGLLRRRAHCSPVSSMPPPPQIHHAVRSVGSQPTDTPYLARLTGSMITV